MLSTGNIAKNKEIKSELANSSSLDSTHQVIAEWNYNAYIEHKEIGCYLSTGSYDDGYQNYKYTVGSDDPVINTDVERIKYTPLKDIFKVNRPNPGIIHYVGNEKSTLPISGKTDELTIKSTFNLLSDNPRVYPISEHYSFKYWNSLRNLGGNLKGVADASSVISDASPFIVYGENIYVNKILVKIQDYAETRYPVNFTVDVKLGSDTNWTTIYTATNSDALKSGVMSIYYDKTQQTNKWVNFTIASKNNPIYNQQDEKTVVDFSKSSLSSDMVSISALRFSPTKMSLPNIPLEIIELSPRLVCDITNNVIDLNINSSVGKSSYGMPIGSVVSSNGSITLSNNLNSFNKNNTDSILQNVLKPNVEIKIYQNLVIGENAYRFPLKTMYTSMWDDADNFTVTTNLEDYFKFFREAAAPDLMIANNNGVPTSVAMLMFLDNVGFTGFRFEKTSPNNDYEDVVLDFFYSKKEQSVLEVLESIAISTQTSIYMDVDNELIAMSKEKAIGSENKDFWFIGNDGVTQKYDNALQDSIGYVSNIASFAEASEPPITDINIEYNGLGLEKKSFSLLTNTDNKKQEHLESPNFGISFINRDLRYTTNIVWQTGNNKDSGDNYLAAAALIQSLPEATPKQFFTSPNYEYASNSYDAVRQLYARTNAKPKLCINLDKEMINTFINTYSGYVMIDAELIRYNGILFFISNPKERTLKKKILFSKEEYNYEKSRLRPGGSIEPEALIVYIEFDSEQYSSTLNKYTILSDGRGSNRTEILAHEAVDTSKEFLTANTDWKKHAVHLWGSKKVPSSIVNGLTVTNRIDNFITNKTSFMVSKSVPGYIRLSAAKAGDHLKSTRKAKVSVKDLLPMDTVSEQILSGIFKTVKVNNKSIPIRRIGTRMRLVSDVPKNVSTGEMLIKEGCIAGIGWNISRDSGTSGMTGYFVEVEDTGTIDAESLLSENYRNLRLYKVYKSEGIYKVKVIRNAWVNVSSTPSISPDMSTALIDAKGGKSYAQIFDLEVVIKDKGNTRYYEVWWDDQQVITASETKPSSETSDVGFITRGKSSAIYEYLYVSSSPDDIVIPKQTTVITKNKDSKLSTLASRGMLPRSLSTSLSNNKVLVHFDDFGKYAREVKKFDVRFDAPSLAPKLISLAEVNPNYYVSEYTAGSFGASFWLYNTANTAIQIDESSQTPLWIAAYSLKSINPGTVQSSKFIEKPEYDKEENDIYTTNRNVYGKQEIILSGDFINSWTQSTSLAKWVLQNLSKERKTINLQIFPNPLLELGDKVGVLYSDKLYNDENKTYSVVSISHGISGNGPTMSVEIRECV
jgi:hypothetical protein